MNRHDEFIQTFTILGRDFSRAGSVSTEIKEILQEIGVPSSIIRRVAIASYEAEMNVVMYAQKGELTLTLNPETIKIEVEDEGQGIEDIELAMQEGYSTATEEMREMGFGAGMGLPNIKKNAHIFIITSSPGVGTYLKMIFYLDEERAA
ncbi:MAG: anti-sigma regulatory factor [Candidatus Aminicenantes bacterium]|nr:ATP-binding protein [Candidatus Aminicenantes bacterium]RLE02988.1 MAG: anti-sigma regulatory factor [Candidatus Aminicenantes bacterium]RLE04057.1 MAG: anti-sigma regulatory factor [Candidatus Aminicenantes bacterium]HHF43502.1 anti-sigma regulatory factor [Candidatus Aminicenantes bacterium]